MFVKFEQIYENVFKLLFWDEVFMVRNTNKTGQSWCSAIIFGKKKRSFEMLFHLKVVSTFWNPFVRDHGESFSQLPKKTFLIGQFLI